VVLDDEKAIINAFLYELPAKGDIFQIIDLATKAGQQISWERRENWCRQIVQGVSEIHSQGFVLGCLGENLDHGIYINADDAAVHTNQFRRKFTSDKTLMAVLPPEYHGSPSIAGSHNRQLTALPQTDLYQLGLLLWRIASHHPYKLVSQFCQLAGCTTNPDIICNEPHACAIQLPSPGEDCPQYLRDIITACRAENPDERPPARKLLHMFPGSNPTFTVEQGDKFMTQLDHDLETRCEVICDKCHKLIPERYYQCNFCNSNDFDLCPDCLAQGAHCFQADHYLREQYVADTRETDSTEETYYSSMKEGGQREIVIL
jgi:serine/threonine protein kinase